MRVYKIGNEYIDLDHVLSVTDIGWDKETTCAHYDAYFYVTLAFRADQKMFAYKYSWRDAEGDYVWSDENELEEKVKAINWYNAFLYAWQNK